MCDDGQLRLVARAVRADASDGEDGSRPSPLGVFFARGGGGFFCLRVFLLSRLYGSHALSFRASELPPLESLDGAKEKRDPHARMSIIV